MIRWPRAIAAAATLLCVPGIQAVAVAQTPTLRVRLAADPERRGPAALTWVRAHVLTELVEWQRGRDPFDGIELSLSAEGIVFAAQDLPEVGDSYLTARLELATAERLDARCEFSGYEVFRGRLSGAPGRLGKLVTLLGLDRSAGPLVLDVGSLVGSRVPALHSDNLNDLFLGLGAAECGELTLRIERRGTSFRVLGRSPGGLTLPSLLWWIADARLDSADDDPVERWITLASCARDAEREEAARQLAVSDDPRAADMLERLLLTDDFTRAVAMDALIRTGGLRALPAVLSAATPEIAPTEELAETALRRWLPRTPVAQRASILGGLPSHTSSAMRSFPDRYGPIQRAAAPLSLRGLCIAIAGISAAILALALWLRRG